jgi:hypothetical protein
VLVYSEERAVTIEIPNPSPALCEVASVSGRWREMAGVLGSISMLITVIG